jgi:hypothetical protein
MHSALILASSLIALVLTFVDDSLSTGQYYKSAYDKDFFYPWLRNILQYSLHYVILVFKFALLKSNKLVCCLVECRQWLFQWSVMTPLARPIVRVLFERRAFGAPASGLVSSLVICCKFTCSSGWKYSCTKNCLCCPLQKLCCLLRCLELLNFLVLHMWEWNLWILQMYWDQHFI